MNITVWMPIWGRHDVLAVTLLGLRDMQRRWLEHGHTIGLHVCTSDNEDLAAVVKHYGAPEGQSTAPNKPLSIKHDKLLSDALDGDADFFLQVGSDDVYLPVGDQFYFAALEAMVDHIGVDCIYIVEPKSKRAIRFSYPEHNCHSLFGAGRLWSRRAVAEAFSDGTLWPAKADRGLDTISELRLKECGYWPHPLQTDQPIIVDIKSEVNIWGFGSYQKNGTQVAYDKVMSLIPEATREEMRNVGLRQPLVKHRCLPRWAEPA